MASYLNEEKHSFPLHTFLLEISAIVLQMEINKFILLNLFYER